MLLVSSGWGAFVIIYVDLPRKWYGIGTARQTCFFAGFPCWANFINEKQAAGRVEDTTSLAI